MLPGKKLECTNLPPQTANAENTTAAERKLALAEKHIGAPFF
jgi:hypothetical protein